MTKEMMLEMAKLGGEIFARGTTQNTRRTIYVHVDIYVKAKFSEIELKSFLGRNNYAVQCRYILGRDGYFLVLLVDTLDTLDKFVCKLKREVPGIWSISTSLLGRSLVKA